MKRRFVSIFLTFCMLFSLTATMSISASAKTVDVVKGISTIKKNTGTTAKYNSNWIYWSQGASGYSAVRDSGCRLVAYSKLLAEIGCADFGNPDNLFAWGIGKKYYTSTSSVYEQKSVGVLPVEYVKQQKGSSDLKLCGTVKLQNMDKNTASKKIMEYINKGYYVILFCGAHTAYVGRQASLNYGAPVILDSYSSYTQYAGTSRTYDKSYSLYTFANFRYYSYKDSNKNPVDTGANTGTGSGTNSGATTDTPSTQPIENGTYHISTALNTNYVLDLTGGSTSNGANIQLYKNAFNGNQSFKVTRLKDGYYEITSAKSGKALDVASAGKKNGTNVQQYTRNNTDAQKWEIRSAGDGYYYIVSKCNGLYLDVTSGKVANKTNIQMYTGNKTNAQKWKFTPVSTLKIDLTSYPSSIKKGSYYGLRGTISSNYKISKVEGYILNSAGKNAISPSIDKPNKTSMDIKTANLNDKLTFNKLSVGTYTMKVVATDSLGKSVTWSKTFKVTK